MQPPYGYGGPPPSYGAPAPSHGGGRTYEFNDGENLVIANVARYARLWGIISLGSGVLVLFCGIILAVAAGMVAGATRSHSGPMSSPAALAAIGVALVPTALVSIIGGVFYMRSGRSLQTVVDTQGNDIPLLTEAVRSLSTALKIEAIAMAVGFVVGLVIGIVARAGGGHG